MTRARPSSAARRATPPPAPRLPPAGPDAFARERQEVAYFMRRLYRQGLTTTSGGNLSRRVGPDAIAITPAALDKARLTSGQIAILTLAGENRTPALPISSEARMHLALYAARPDVLAIVHAHPVTASAFTAAATPINVRLLAESYALIGDPAVAAYALTGTDPLAAEVARVAGTGANCILMRNHGITTLGESLLRAFDRLELLEAAARMTLVAAGLQGVRSLDAAQCAALDRLMGRAAPAPPEGERQ